MPGFSVDSLWNIYMTWQEHTVSVGRFVHLHAKKWASGFLSFLRYCKNIVDLLFWVLWACLIIATKNDGICFKETLILFFMQKIKFISYLFLAKIVQLCYFGYIRHAWPPTTKQQYLPVGTFGVYLHFFLEILHFNKFSVWLATTILNDNLRKRLLSDKGFAKKYMAIWCFILDYFHEKVKTK